MRSSFPPLSCLLAFEAAARRNGFAAAASELSLTPSAVSHQIAKLEELLGVRLFDRSGRQVALTDAGREYMGRVSLALEAISAATDQARKGVRNRLHVHSSPSFASLWLMPRLAAFAKRHPQVALSLSSSPAAADFAVGQVDVEIRYGVPPAHTLAHLHAEPVFEERILPLASPAFLAAHPIAQPEDLLGLPLIQSAVNVVQWPDWLRSRRVAAVPGAYAYSFDRSVMALEAAVQGLGVACESTSIAAMHLRDARLQPVFDERWCLKAQAHFMVCPQRHLDRPQVLSFIEWVRGQASGRDGSARRRRTAPA